MDTMTITIIAIFACIILAAFLVFRRRSKVEIKGPLNIGLKLEATNESSPPSPAVRIERVKSSGGGLLAEDNTGRGAEVKDVEVQDDILVSSAESKQNHDPKV